MAKAEADGQLVNIPTRLYNSMEGRSVVYGASQWFDVLDVRVSCRQIRMSFFNDKSKRRDDVRL